MLSFLLDCYALYVGMVGLIISDVVHQKTKEEYTVKLRLEFEKRYRDEQAEIRRLRGDAVGLDSSQG
jgi:hypothetical protein